MTEMFRNFLLDENTYAECERFWSDMVEELAEELGQHGQWKPWMPTTYHDGTPVEKDGNPILERRSERLDKAIRVTQQPCEEDVGLIAAWINETEPEFTDIPGAELAMNLTLTEATAARAKDFTRKWMTEATTTEEMRGFLKRMPEA